MAKASWGFSVGAVKAKEIGLFTKQDIEQLISFKSINKLNGYLHDKGYGYTDTETDTEQLLTNETEKLWQYVFKIVPDISVFTPILLNNDFHNLKVAVKGIISGRKYDHLFLHPSVTEALTIEKAVKDKDYSLLPDYMVDTAHEAAEILLRTADAQLSDGIIDKGLMEAELNTAEKSSSHIIKEYFLIKVFYENIKIALRGAKASKPISFYDYSLCTNKHLETDDLKKSALSGVDRVLEYMRTKNVFGSAELADIFEESPTAFEKAVDNKMMSVIKRAKSLTFGPDVVVGYTLGKLAEIKAVRMIASGIRTESDENTIRERLRELYD